MVELTEVMHNLIGQYTRISANQMQAYKNLWESILPNRTKSLQQRNTQPDSKANDYKETKDDHQAWTIDMSELQDNETSVQQLDQIISPGDRKKVSDFAVNYIRLIHNCLSAKENMKEHRQIAVTSVEHVSKLLQRGMASVITVREELLKIWNSFTTGLLR